MMTNQARAVVAAVVLGGVALFGVSAAAEAQARSFNLSTPGARANAMGRAFIGVADDASAAVTNPAGLILLSRPQIYLEFKGPNKFIDDFGDRVGQTGSLSFLGVSAPVGTRLSVGFVRHEFFNYEDEGLDLDVRGVSYGGSVATALDQNLKVGVTLAHHDDGFENTAFGAIFGALWTSENFSVGVAAAKSDSFVMPARFGGGLAFRPTPRSLVAADVAWIGYEATGLADDAATVGAGIEHEVLVRGDTRVFGRAGVFSQSGGGETFGVEPDRTVGTFGVGLTSGLKFQLDAAVLTNRDVVVSAAVRF